MHRCDSEGDPERNVAVGKEETLVLTLIRETKELGRGKMSGNSPARSNATGQTEAERLTQDTQRTLFSINNQNRLR